MIAPEAYPAEWQVIQAGKAAHRFDAILAVYQAGIADQPDKAEPFTNRAWFLERIYNWRPAIDDISRAIATDPTADSYLWRGRLYWNVGEKDKALADILEARKIDPASDAVIQRLASLYADRKEYDKALALLDTRIEDGGKDKADFMLGKADVLSRAGRKDDAIATIDAAVASKPGAPDLLNQRCWLKGTLNVMLDTALKDCTKADRPQRFVGKGARQPGNGLFPHEPDGRRSVGPERGAGPGSGPCRQPVYARRHPQEAGRCQGRVRSIWRVRG